MIKRVLIVGAAAIFGFVFMLDGNVHGGKDPVSIKIVMKKAMKSGLYGKVAGGKASDDEKKQLVDLFTDLAANKAPKGNADNWKKRTTEMLEAAKSGDTNALKKAVDCKACHDEHK
jgi:hypothetical protein